MTNLEPEPCNACGSKVTLVAGRGPGRLGAPGDVKEVRRCTNPRCRMNTGPKRLGDRV